jgi:hypothetical protein
MEKYGLLYGTSKESTKTDKKQKDVTFFTAYIYDCFRRKFHV